MAFAKNTKVPVERTLGEIQKVLYKAGAKGFAFGTGGSQAYIAFTMGRSAVKMKVKMHQPPSENATQASIKTYEQLQRSRYRALLLAIKAKVESVEAGIETYEQAFLPHLLLQNGKLVGELVIEKIDMLNNTEPSLLLGI